MLIDENGDTITSAINEIPPIIPENMKLYPVYPNPFNPSTTIEYTLAKSNHVALIIYNTLGEEVKTLVNKYQTIGNYRISFNANNLTSGVYFYQLTTGGGSITRKMIYLK
jgi:hypothetical protein